MVLWCTSVYWFSYSTEMYLALLNCTVEKPYLWHHIREGSYSIHSAFSRTWRSGRKDCRVLLFKQFLWCLSNSEVAKKKNVSADRDRQNNEERVHKSTGSVLGLCQLIAWWVEFWNGTSLTQLFCVGKLRLVTGWLRLLLKDTVISSRGQLWRSLLKCLWARHWSPSGLLLSKVQPKHQ